jgi:hypothetical protein
MGVRVVVSVSAAIIDKRRGRQVQGGRWPSGHVGSYNTDGGRHGLDIGERSNNSLRTVRPIKVLLAGR